MNLITISNDILSIYLVFGLAAIQAHIHTTISTFLKNPNELRLRFVGSTTVLSPLMCSALCLSNGDCQVFTVVATNASAGNRRCDAKYDCLMHKTTIEDGPSQQEDLITSGTTFILKNRVRKSTDFCQTQCNVSATFYDYLTNDPVVYCANSNDFYLVDANDLCTIIDTYQMPGYSGQQIGAAFNLKPDVIALQDVAGEWYFYNITVHAIVTVYHVPTKIQNDVHTLATSIDQQQVLLIDTNHNHVCVNIADFEGNERKRRKRDSAASEVAHSKTKKPKNDKNKKSNNEDDGDQDNQSGNGNNNSPKKEVDQMESSTATGFDQQTTESTLCESEWQRVQQISAGGLELIGRNYYTFNYNKGKIIAQD